VPNSFDNDHARICHASGGWHPDSFPGAAGLDPSESWHPDRLFGQNHDSFPGAAGLDPSLRWDDKNNGWYDMSGVRDGKNRSRDDKRKNHGAC
jgi:hypothetical protein